jgi:hypothetical protein
MASFDALGPDQTLDASFCRSFFFQSVLDLPVILDLHFGSDTIKTTRLIKNRRVDNTFK